MMRFGAGVRNGGGDPRNSQRTYLSAIVASLLGGDAEDAQATYADVSDVPNFQKSDEQRAAYCLPTAYRDADADAIRAAVSPCAAFGFLDAPFSRGAKRLPTPKQNLRAMSEKMGGGGGVMATGEDFLGRRVDGEGRREGGRATGSRTTTISREWARRVDGEGGEKDGESDGFADDDDLT